MEEFLEWKKEHIIVKGPKLSFCLTHKYRRKLLQIKKSPTLLYFM